MSGEGPKRLWVDRIRDLATATLPWGILGIFGTSLLAGGVNEGLQRLVHQNGAVLLLVAILIQYAPRAIDAQKAQAAAMADLAASVRELPRTQDMKFEQVLVGLQHLADQIERIDSRGGGEHGTGG